MKNRSKRIIAVLTLVLSLLLCSCSGKEDPTQTAVTTTPHDSDSSYSVAFVMYDYGYMENTMREAFISRMRTLGYDEMKMKFDVKNAHGDSNNLTEQINSLKNSEYDLIVALSDEPAIAISKANVGIPCVFIGATDPVGDGLAENTDTPDRNITGAVMNLSAKKTVSLIRIFTPDVNTVGVVYLKSNAKVTADLEEFRKTAVSEGLKLENIELDSIDSAQEKIEEAVKKVDAFYIPKDYQLDEIMENLTRLTVSEEKFIFSSGMSAVSSGALAAYCSSPEELAKSAALMADEIIKGKAVSELPIDFSVEPNIFLSSKTYSLLGIGYPELEGLVVV